MHKNKIQKLFVGNICKDTETLKVKVQRGGCTMKTLTKNKFTIILLKSDKVEFMRKCLSRNKTGHFMMIDG